MSQCLAIDGCHVTIHDCRQTHVKTFLSPMAKILNKAFVRKQIHKCILARYKRRYWMGRAQFNLPWSKTEISQTQNKGFYSTVKMREQNKNNIIR